MKLLGRDISTTELLRRVEGQLRARGLLERGNDAWARSEGDPLSVDPISYNLTALEQTADPVEPTRRELSLAERTARLLVRPLLRVAFETQRAFNGHVRDSYAQLSAEVIRLRAEVAALKDEQGPKKTEERPSRGRSPARRTPKR